MMKGISLKALAVGSLMAIVSDFVATLLVLISIVLYQRNSERPVLIWAKVPDVVFHSNKILLLTVLPLAALYVLCGYTAGRLAGTREISHAFAITVLSRLVLVVLTMLGPRIPGVGAFPVWYIYASYFVVF